MGLRRMFWPWIGRFTSNDNALKAAVLGLVGWDSGVDGDEDRSLVITICGVLCVATKL